MKKFALLVILSFSLIMFTGCNFYRKVTFNLDNGDKVEIKLDANDNYSITTELPFHITKDGSTVSVGSFLTLEEYEEYKENIKNNEGYTIIEESDDTILYDYKSEEYNCIMKLPRSNTALLLKNEVSLESAREVFARLTITTIKELTR